MPDDSKKQHKGKHDPKEQRRPRRSGKQAHNEPKIEKKLEDKVENKVTAQKPVYESPGPEFYNSLKRETDEILKITEEENSKYKKKEIQSNWTKYEMPIESYEEIEEQENMGADYEKLIQAPLSAGGHFQFKHEKSWDMTIGPSLYDKYFDINMDNLSTALCTIPFYERNGADLEMFTETDILTMNNRATRFKQKYYNDKTYTTPELEAQDKILNSLKDNLSKREEDIHLEAHDPHLVLDNKIRNIETVPQEELLNSNVTNTDTKPIISNNDAKLDLQDILEINDKIKNIEVTSSPVENIQEVNVNIAPIKIKNICDFEDIILDDEIKASGSVQTDVKKAESISKSQVAPGPAPKNPVIESPDDLEKWLDDFLDG